MKDNRINYDLERKLRRYAIGNLMKYIVIGQGIVFALMYIWPTLGYRLYSLISLTRAGLMRGQIWRLVTFVFTPPSSSPIFILFALYFYYMIGLGLENQWGKVRFNLYYGVGMLSNSRVGELDLQGFCHIAGTRKRSPGQRERDRDLGRVYSRTGAPPLATHAAGPVASLKHGNALIGDGTNATARLPHGDGQAGFLLCGLLVAHDEVMRLTRTEGSLAPAPRPAGSRSRHHDGAH